MKMGHSETSHVSRRNFLAGGLSAPALLTGGAAEAAPAAADVRMPSSLLDIDSRALVSRADLVYSQPVSRSEEGMPVGNGAMGSLVWTTPEAMHFQINRVDVFAMDSNSHSFPFKDQDYSSGCGYVDINLVHAGDDAFTGNDFEQKLNVYDGLLSLRGNGISARVFAWPDRDVMAVEVDDRRARPEPVDIDLRMLRYAIQYFYKENFRLASAHTVKMQTRHHTATSKLDIADGRIVLTQEFREGAHYSASAVAIGIAGRAAKAHYASESAVRLSAGAAQGRFTIFIASAASAKPEENVAALALANLDAAAAQGFDALLSASETWWHNFWSKAFIHLHSADGVADFVEQNYTYFLYVMASCSRGPAMPRYGGLIWYTTGDMRKWGAQHWWHNAGCYYEGLLPANRMELMAPMFRTYSGMLNNAASAAERVWGSKGIWLPETTYFNGPEHIPDELVKEVQDIYLVRKPWEARSDRFKRYGENKHGHAPLWNWKGAGKWVEGTWVWEDKGASPFAHVSHIFSSTAKIASVYWQRYEYTQDREWLAQRAYPVLKGTVEFYRNFPNLKKGPDGKYHIRHVNNHEGIWDCEDAQEEISAMRGVTPMLVRAAEILNRDTDLLPVWREFLANLAPLPTNSSIGTRGAGQPEFWVGAVPPVRSGNPGAPQLVPAVYYDLCTVATEDRATFALGQASYEAVYGSAPADESTIVRTLSYAAIQAANLGRAADVRYLIPSQIRHTTATGDHCDVDGDGHTTVLRNRLTLREGPGCMDCQRLGRASHALHNALLQSAGAGPAAPPVIRVFAAWPKEWDAEFTLLAKGAVLVTSAIRSGRIEFVELRPQAEGECQVKNPWGEGEVALYRNGTKAEALRGSMLTIKAGKDETLLLLPSGTTPQSARRTVKI